MDWRDRPRPSDRVRRERARKRTQKRREGRVQRQTLEPLKAWTRIPKIGEFLETDEGLKIKEFDDLCACEPGPQPHTLRYFRGWEREYIVTVCEACKMVYDVKRHMPPRIPREK